MIPDVNIRKIIQRKKEEEILKNKPKKLIRIPLPEKFVDPQEVERRKENRKKLNGKIITKRIKPPVKEKPILISKKVRQMIEIWNEFAEKEKHFKIFLEKPTKTRDNTILACRSFLSGSIFEERNFIPPHFMNKIEKRGYTIEEFKEGLQKWNFRRTIHKTSLFIFLYGSFFANLPSLMFTFGLTDPVEYKCPEETKYFIESWGEFSTDPLTFKDKQLIDEFIANKLPDFNELKEGLQTLQSFESGFDFLQWLVFAALQSLKDKGWKTIMPHTLHQLWFNGKLEEIRKFHNYTV